LARWEPGHGRFNFRHPWRQYVKIGASMRSCASCLDALIGCINSDNKVFFESHKRASNQYHYEKSAKSQRHHFWCNCFWKLPKWDKFQKKLWKCVNYVKVARVV